MAVAKDRQDLPAALRGRTRIRGTCGHDDAVLVGIFDYPIKANYDGSADPYKGGGSKGEYRQRTDGCLYECGRERIRPSDVTETNAQVFEPKGGKVLRWMELIEAGQDHITDEGRESGTLSQSLNTSRQFVSGSITGRRAKPLKKSPSEAVSQRRKFP